MASPQMWEAARWQGPAPQVGTGHFPGPWGPSRESHILSL